jgi:5-methylcytosine-specific restriction endonuclease McrA
MLDLIPHTKRRSMTKARAAKIFLAHNGICCNCGQQIKQGDSWFIEHVESLALGGADDDKNARPAHTKCKAKKDAIDAAEKAKRDRLVTASWEGARKSKCPSQRLGRGNHQHSATRPLRRKEPT